MRESWRDGWEDYWGPPERVTTARNKAAKQAAERLPGEFASFRLWATSHPEIAPLLGHGRRELGGIAQPSLPERLRVRDVAPDIAAEVGLAPAIGQAAAVMASKPEVPLHDSLMVERHAGAVSLNLPKPLPAPPAPGVQEYGGLPSRCSYSNMPPK